MTPAARRILGSVIVIGVVAAAGAALYVRGPGPMSFSGGPKVALADYKGPNPTGVPANMTNASPIERGEYLARAADCMVCHTAPGICLPCALNRYSPANPPAGWCEVFQPPTV